MSDTSGSEKKALEKAQGELQSDFVYDFLYHDVRRVGSFLAQFDDSGHLQSLSQTETKAKGAKRGWKLSAGGGLPAEVGTGEISFERSPAEGGSEGLERVYDPLWTNARTLLDFLATADMIQTDIESARIGQFVLKRGQLVVLDLLMLKEAVYGVA